LYKEGVLFNTNFKEAHMSNKWKAGPDIHQVLDQLITDYHGPLVDIAKDIVVIFKQKASRTGGRPVYGKTSKAPAILSVLGEHEYKFVIELGADTWQDLKDDEKTALLDHLLCFISSEIDPKTGDVKYFLTSPDVFYFQQEIDRHGHWRPAPKEETEASAEVESVSQVDPTELF
jgi:hypothetical protein